MNNEIEQDLVLEEVNPGLAAVLEAQRDNDRTQEEESRKIISVLRQNGKAEEMTYAQLCNILCVPRFVDDGWEDAVTPAWGNNVVVKNGFIDAIWSIGEDGKDCPDVVMAILRKGFVPSEDLLRVIARLAKEYIEEDYSTPERDIAGAQNAGETAAVPAATQKTGIFTWVRNWLKRCA